MLFTFYYLRSSLAFDVLIDEYYALSHVSRPNERVAAFAIVEMKKERRDIFQCYII